MNAKFKIRLYEIVFEADTPAGKTFDLTLLIAILLSIIFLMLESVKSINEQYGAYLKIAEWIMTGIFTAEYFIRIYIVNKRYKYIFSFYGIIDLLSILPLYVSFFIPGTHGLAVIRSLRLLRIFRILKLSRYVSESKAIITALLASKQKISVFFFFVITIVIILGTVMYMIEDETSGFTSIPQSIYWAIVTLTTVGYGDIAPSTVTGKFIASIVMILGYAIIAVPTGIVTSEFTNLKKDKKITTQVCPNCLKEGHDENAVYCKFCGSIINEETGV